MRGLLAQSLIGLGIVLTGLRVLCLVRVDEDLGELRDALKSWFAVQIEGYDPGRALKIAGQAVEWGYAVAVGCSLDLRFVRHLTIFALNDI